MLTTYATDEFIFQGLRAGAQANLLKDTSVVTTAAIRSVQAGQILLAPAVAARLVVQIPGVQALTARARGADVHRPGRSNSEIAALLSIAPRNAKVHVQLMGKLVRPNPLRRESGGTPEVISL
ncbi:MAG: hypothetical protein U0Z44_02980 [Kouleothrix sp.]